jgi:hypothetical protein
MSLGGEKMARDTNSIKECILQNKLCLYPTLVEQGLFLVERETILILDGKKHKPDILYKDYNGQNLYVEVKLKVNDNDNAIEQVLAYKSQLNDLDNRFLIIAEKIDDSMKLKMKQLEIEYITIPNETSVCSFKSDEIIEVPKGNRKFNDKRELLVRFNKRGLPIAEKIFDVVREIHLQGEHIIFCNISDGIMLQRVDRGEKFLTLTSIGDRLLFHLPNAKRDEYFKRYCKSIPFYRAEDASTQIDLKLKDIDILNFEFVKVAIKDLYDNYY